MTPLLQHFAAAHARFSPANANVSFPRPAPPRDEAIAAPLPVITARSSSPAAVIVGNPPPFSGRKMDAPPAIHVPAEVAVDHDRLISCLIHKEQNPWSAPGGALGFQPKSWAEETTLPYRLASHEPSARIVAKQRLARFSAICTRFGVKVTPEVLAQAWRRGISNAMSRAKTGRFEAYTIETCNLYRDPAFK